MKTRLTILIVFGLVLGTTACDKGFEELNQNPNVSTAADPDQLFAYAMLRYHTDYFNGVQTEIWGLNSWMQVQANISGISSIQDAYFMSGDAINGSWSLMYADVLGNLNEAIRLTSATTGDRQAQSNMYRIYRAYIFQRITDLWGHAPYSAAHNAVNEAGEPDFTPSYDSQEAIYFDLVDELTDAIDGLEQLDATTAGSDWIYGGDIAKWRRFANSLLLRIAVRISEVRPDITQDILSEMDFNDLILDNSQSATFPHSSSARSAFYELHNTAQGMYNPSKYLVDRLVAEADPRIARYAEYSPESVVFGTNQYVGVPSFVPASEIDPNDQNTFTMSYIGEYFLDVDREGILMSSAEVQFLLAEAALKGWISGDAQSYYEAGVTQHMEQLAIETTEVDDYLSGNGAYNGTLEQIATEKWKTFIYSDALELYSEWRRTGYPVITDNNGSAIDESNVPVRLAYPNSELSLNMESVSAVGHGINDFFTPHWWDE